MKMISSSSSLRMKMMSSILLLLILSSCLCATFVVNVAQSSYQAEEKQNITLEWTFTTKTQGTWRELFIYCSLVTPDKELVLYQVHDGVEIPESQDDQFSGRVQSDKDVLREGRIRLHVSRLRTEDSGLYGCDVKTEDGSNNAECRLSVFVNYHLDGSKGPIKAPVGSDVLLPCFVKPPVNAIDATIKWKFNSSETVHFRRDRSDGEESQAERYRKRTHLNHTMLEHGDISLKLTNVSKDNAGIYTCFVRRLPDQDKSEERNVILIVGDKTEDPDKRSGGPEAVVIAGAVVGAVVGSVVGLAALIFITYCVVRRWRVFPCWSKNSQHEPVRNDEDRRENVDPGNGAEKKPLQDLGQQNQRV